MVKYLFIATSVFAFAACSDANGGKGDEPVGDGSDGSVDDGSGTGDNGTGDDGSDGTGDGTDGTDDGVDCDPSLADCDAVCVCDGSALEDDCIEHQCAVGCTEPQGYWKNSPETWPVTELVMGGRSYTPEQAAAFMDLPRTGDASIILAAQLATTKLNLVSNVTDAEIQDEIEAADAWLAANDDGDGVPFAIDTSDERAAEALTLKTELADFNGGLLGPGACAAPADTGAISTDTGA